MREGWDREKYNWFTKIEGISNDPYAFENMRICVCTKWNVILTTKFLNVEKLTLINGISLKLEETTITLKWVSEPGGTLCW